MSGARLFKAALAGACLVGLSGCVSLLPEPTPVSVYRLSSPEPLEWSGQDWTIVLIEQPRAPRGLSGDEIAVLRNGQSLAYVSGARWISPVPGLLQNQVIDTFNAASSGLAPARPEDGVRADYELRLDLREYEADYDRGAEGARWCGSVWLRGWCPSAAGTSSVRACSQPRFEPVPTGPGPSSMPSTRQPAR